jgi:hypothetical protein
MTHRKNSLSKALVISLVFFVFYGCTKQPPAKTANEPSITGYGDIIPLTEGNIRGHKLLYDEGWFVVSSTKEALEYAKVNSIEASSGIMRRIAKAVISRSKDLGREVNSDVKDSYQRAENLLKGGTKVSGGIGLLTGLLVESEFDYTKQTFIDACDTFVQGHIHLARRTADDLHDLKSLPGNYFDDLRDDFSNIFELSSNANQSVSNKIALSWDQSFDEAATAFREEYDQSGKRGNSLTALGDILTGYLKAFYSGVAQPSAKALVSGSAKGTNSFVFLPCATVTMVAGRTIEATGLTLYYSAKTGYHVISPTIETGLLSSLSLLSMASIPVTAASGAGLCAVNQVAFTAAAPMYGTGKALTDTAIDTGKYVALVGHDVTLKSSHVMINHIKTGVVLGYNALTAIPVHLFLGVADTAVFLAYDGPRLVIAVARGGIRHPAGEGTFSVGNLPTGSVVDLHKLEQEKGVSIEVVTDDPAIIKSVIKNLPKDLGGHHE